MDILRAILLLLAACAVLSAPVMGCTITNDEYVVKINLSANSCPIPDQKYNVDGWQKIVSGGFGQATKLKLNKAGPQDNVSEINWADSAKAFLEHEGGTIINTEEISVSGNKGVKVKAFFAGGKGIIIDIPLENNNLFEAISKNETELEEVLDGLMFMRIEE
jgi:hypothetical protein